MVIFLVESNACAWWMDWNFKTSAKKMIVKCILFDLRACNDKLEYIDAKLVCYYMAVIVHSTLDWYWVVQRSSMVDLKHHLVNHLGGADRTALLGPWCPPRQLCSQLIKPVCTNWVLSCHIVVQPVKHKRCCHPKPSRWEKAGSQQKHCNSSRDQYRAEDHQQWCDCCQANDSRSEC